MVAVSRIFCLCLSLQAILIFFDQTGNARVIPRLANAKTKRSSMAVITHLYCESLLRSKNVFISAYKEHCGRVTGMKRSGRDVLQNIFSSQHFSMEKHKNQEKKNKLIQGFLKLVEQLEITASGDSYISNDENLRHTSLDNRSAIF